MLSTPVAAESHETVLANGLRVVIVPSAAAPVATLLVVYRVGARNEAVGYTGSSHLLEHMLFKGTPGNNRGNGRAFADIMNEIGASKNATTWLDRTMYFETVPVEFLPLAIELEADRMRGALILDEERRSEMTVVRNELERNDNSSSRVLNSALVATAFREHPYHHPTIGWRADVEGVSTERLRDLYDTFYHPDNATVFVIGDIEIAATLELVETHFGALPAAAHAIPSVYTSEPAQLGERSVLLKRPGDDTLLALAYHTPSAFGANYVLDARTLAGLALDRPAHNDTYALEVLGRILGRGRTSRLSRALVDEHLALDVSAWNWGSRDPGLFQIMVSVRPGVDPDSVRRETERVLATLESDGPTAEEVERAQTQIAVQRAFGRDGTFALAQRLAEFDAVGSWHLDDDLLERIRAVTPDDVRAAVRTYLHEDNRSVGTLVPGTPKTLTVANAPHGSSRVAEASVPMAPLAVPPRTREHRFSERIARTSLPNGVTAWYAANPGSATVVVRGLLDAGAAYAPGRPMLPSIVGEMLARGTRSHARIAIEERLERAGVRRQYSVDDDRASHYDPLAFRFSGACAASDLPLLLETLAEELREPAFLDDELERVKSELTGTLKLLRTNTGWRAVQRFLELAYEPGDGNAEPALDVLLADVAATTADDLRKFYSQTLLRTRPLLAGCGALDETAFASLAAQTLGSVPFAARARDDLLPVVRARPNCAGFERVELERKASVDIVLGRTTTLVRSSPDFLAASIANGILGQSTLSSRLGLRLRDREGLTYGVTSSFLAGGRAAGPWRITVSVNPANVERAIASAKDVLDDYAATGPTTRELVQQRNSMSGSQRVALATNGGIAQQLERIALYRLGDDFVDTYRERLASITADDVRVAIGTYFDPRDLLIVAAGTFAPALAR